MNDKSEKPDEKNLPDAVRDLVDSKIEKLPKNVGDLTRYLTDEERSKIEAIELNGEDLDEFMNLLKQGLLRAASSHDAAVQDNFALRAETVIRLSRPVYNSETNSVDYLEGEETVVADLQARKVYRSDQENK